MEDLILARLAEGEVPPAPPPETGLADLCKRMTLRLPPAAMALIVEYDEACTVVERLIAKEETGAPLDTAVSILDQCAIDLDRVLTEVRRRAGQKNW